MDLVEDADQQSIIESTVSHLVVTAPPGTGKTLTAALAATHAAGTIAEHERVLIMTFSNQARAQINREVRRVAPPTMRTRIVVTNYHQFSWHGLSSYRRALALPESLRLVSRRRRLAILRAADAVALNLIPDQYRDDVPEFAFPRFRPQAFAPNEEQIGRLLSAARRDRELGNITFGDFGALFWELLERYPFVAAAYRARFPIVVADEHQDASALQDALIRFLAPRRLIVLADPMQLIHGWRGADESRLAAHQSEAQANLSLKTAHRWGGDRATAQWLLGVRSCLDAGSQTHRAPASVRIATTPSHQGQNGLLGATRVAALRAMQSGMTSIAVLASKNDQVVTLRSFLTRHGLAPRQLGMSIDTFMELGEDLPGLEGRALVSRALQIVYALVPEIDETVKAQIAARLLEAGVRRTGASALVGALLGAVEGLYTDGNEQFFVAVHTSLRACEVAQLHISNEHERRVWARAASQGGNLDVLLRNLAAYVTQASHEAIDVAAGVTAMTVHQSKGREFDAVILFDASDRDYPNTADRRKVFYVAVTRAKRSWDFIAKDGAQSPLLVCLGVT
jgi:superfamily I DNA/RNA helicase